MAQSLWDERRAFCDEIACAALAAPFIPLSSGLVPNLLVRADTSLIHRVTMKRVFLKSGGFERSHQCIYCASPRYRSRAQLSYAGMLPHKLPPASAPRRFTLAIECKRPDRVRFSRHRLRPVASPVIKRPMQSDRSAMVRFAWQVDGG